MPADNCGMLDVRRRTSPGVRLVLICSTIESLSSMYDAQSLATAASVSEIGFPSAPR